jgi:hypothetical protein
MKQLKSFSFYRDCEQTDSRDIAAGRIERCQGADFTGSSPVTKTIGMIAVAAFAAGMVWPPPTSSITR